MKPMSFVSYFALIVGLLDSFAWASVTTSLPRSVDLFASPQAGWSGVSGGESPFALFSNFPTTTVGKYLTLATGPEYTNIDSIRSVSFNGQIFNGECRVAHAPFALTLQSFSDQQSDYKRQSDNLKSCVRMRVRDVAPVRPAENQQFCTVERVNDYEVLLSGGLCFLEIHENSTFRLAYEVNPDCKDTSKFADLGLQPLDIFAKTLFFISGDATGRSPFLKPLGNTSLRFSIEAPTSHVQLSVDMGQGAPRWPVRLYTDVHMGLFELEKNSREANLITRIFAANECPDENSMECRYAFPLGLKYSLYEIRDDGKTTLLDQWYGGGVAPARWKGFLPARRMLSYKDFQDGRRYRLEADLTYLSIYHRLFREGFRNFLVKLGLLDIDPNQPLGPIPPISILPSLAPLQGTAVIPPVQPLSPSSPSDFSLELNRMRALMTGSDWPPFYQRICGTSKCGRALEGEAKLVVGVDFTIEKFVDGRAETKQHRLWRKSNFLPEYDRGVEDLMRAECQ